MADPVDPKLGEVWTHTRWPSPARPRGCVVSRDDTSVSLIDRFGNRASIGLSTLALMWEHTATAKSQKCCRCENPTFYLQYLGETPQPVCSDHLNPNLLIHFQPGPETPLVDDCPACGSSIAYAGSASGFVALQDPSAGVLMNCCGQCRREWTVVRAGSGTTEELLRVAGELSQVAERIESLGTQVKIFFNRVLADNLAKVVGGFGDPPTYLGIPVETRPGPAHSAFVVGYAFNQAAPKAPWRQEVFANFPDTVPRVNEVWWTAYYTKIHIYDVQGDNVKFREDGVSNVLPLEIFKQRYSRRCPTPPCEVGEEWVHKDQVVTIEALTDGAAEVVEGDRRWVLPYESFGGWRKLERKNLFERIAEESD